jgi:hypothetical protein
MPEQCAMREPKVGDHAQVKLSVGRIVQATIKAVVETTEGLRIQVSFGSETVDLPVANCPGESLTFRSNFGAGQGWRGTRKRNQNNDLE